MSVNIHHGDDPAGSGNSNHFREHERDGDGLLSDKDGIAGNWNSPGIIDKSTPERSSGTFAIFKAVSFCSGHSASTFKTQGSNVLVVAL